MFITFEAQVSLPEFGVGIGPIPDDAEPPDSGVVHVHINNRMECDRLDALLTLPVVRKEREPDEPTGYEPYQIVDSYLFLSAGGPIVAAEIVASHVESMIWDNVIPTPRLRGSVQSKHADRNGSKGPVRALDPARWSDSVPLRPKFRYVAVPIPRERWKNADGLLFLQYSGPPWRGECDTIANQIRTLFARKNVERCIVPSTATRRREDKDRLCFAVGSCQFTRGLIDGTPPWDEFRNLRPGPADKSFSRLVGRLRIAPDHERPEFLALVGDQVYVDGTAGLFDPAIEDGRYTKPYQQLLSSVYLQEITRQIPICAMLDDHEIEDNWEHEDAEAERKLFLGRQSYLDYQRQGSLLRDPSPESELWSELNFHGFDFFFADSRTDREKRTAKDVSKKRLVSKKQMSELTEFLKDPGGTRSTPRFVITASTLLPPKLSTVQGTPAAALHSDAWDGYPLSQGELFDFIAEEKIRGLHFLSGDEHRCLTSKAVLSDDPRVVVTSIHSSGFYAPYAFAVAAPEDFVDATNTLRLKIGKYEWDLTTRFENAWDGDTKLERAGEGFAVLRVERDNPEVGVTFDVK